MHCASGTIKSEFQLQRSCEASDFHYAYKDPSLFVDCQTQRVLHIAGVMSLCFQFSSLSEGVIKSVIQSVNIHLDFKTSVVSYHIKGHLISSTVGSMIKGVK